MTLYDSSVLVDYLDGEEGAVEYVETHLDERAAAPPLVLFEVYRGEVFKSGPADFDVFDRALGWLTVVDETAALARAAGNSRTNSESGERRSPPVTRSSPGPQRA